MALGVDSASNRNEYQEHFLGGKGGRCVRLTTLPPSCAVVMKFGNLNFLEPSGPLQACNGTALPLPLPFIHDKGFIFDGTVNCGESNVTRTLDFGYTRFTCRPTTHVRQAATAPANNEKPVHCVEELQHVRKELDAGINSHVET